MRNPDSKLKLKRTTLRKLTVEEIMHIEGGSSAHNGELQTNRLNAERPRLGINDLLSLI